MRRAEADEGRDQDHVLLGVCNCGHRAGRGGIGDDLEAVAQPLHGGAGNENRALEGIGALAAELIGNGRQKLALRGNGARCPY